MVARASAHVPTTTVTNITHDVPGSVQAASPRISTTSGSVSPNPRAISSGSPLDRAPFYVPLALPGDDVTPERFVCFRFDGRQGLYIHPDIWHEGVFGLAGRQRFFDKQGAVHARVSVDFAREFGCLLEAAIAP